ncbi:MAG: CBS domain-containing protein [Desulfurococcaceae archaeon]|uniref:CBS domain-containing protein n=1 Tax=Staphylothermus marinus TaxID=2280 RepID=A0A7C4NN85_STAMA
MVIPYKAIDVAKTVPTVNAESTVREVALMILNQGVDLVVVVKDDRVVGTVSPRDILWGLIYGRVSLDDRIENVVNRRFIQVSPEESIDSILEIMRRGERSEVLVFEDNKPVGVVAASSFVNIVEDIIESLEAKSIRSYGKKPL